MYWRNEYAASHKIHFCKHNTFEDFLLLYNSDELGYNLKTAGKCNFQCTIILTATNQLNCIFSGGYNIYIVILFDIKMYYLIHK